MTNGHLFFRSRFVLLIIHWHFKLRECCVRNDFVVGGNTSWRISLDLMYIPKHTRIHQRFDEIKFSVLAYFLRWSRSQWPDILATPHWSNKRLRLKPLIHHRPITSDWRRCTPARLHVPVHSSRYLPAYFSMSKWLFIRYGLFSR